MATQNRSYASQFLGRRGNRVSHVEIITGPQMDVFDKLLMANEDTRKQVEKVIKKGLQKARKQSADDLGAQIPNNQRHAEKAVRSRTYSKKSGTLGGYVTIMRRKHRNGNSSKRPLPTLKDGSEPNWSDRTKQMWGYQGIDAQFLLWWLTVGTDARFSGVGRKNYKSGRYGQASTSAARKKYFGGTHYVGKINAETISPRLVEIVDRITSGEIIPNLDALMEEIANK